METQKTSMHAILLACSSLKDFVEQAQMNMETDYPVWYLDKSYHREPDPGKIFLQNGPSFCLG